MSPEFDQERLAELVEYTRHDLARRDAAADVAPGSGQHVHIHHHYAPAREAAPVPEMDIASRYAGHFVLLLGGVVILAAVTVVLVMLAQVFMVMMTSLAVCCVAVAASVGKLRYSKIDKQMGDQRERAAKRRK
jgi:hypothetical protein